MAAAKSNRMRKEIADLRRLPPPGTSCWCKDTGIDALEADIFGAEGSPYQGGIFRLEIDIPDRYPFEPPKVKFVTQIYHPNIDNGGRICLDVLKLPPKGSWKPTYNIATVLSSIQLLMVEPNPNDPLMADIAEEFTKDKAAYMANAKQWTMRYAMDNTVGAQDKALAEVSQANSSTRPMTDEKLVTCERPAHLNEDKKENDMTGKRTKLDS